MQFTIPQFISREARIVGPLTFKQLVFIGAAAGIVLFLYFTVAARSFVFFIISSIFFLGWALALAFLKIEKTPLPIVIKNFLFFLFKPKIFLWKKKLDSPKVIQLREKIEETEEESPLKVGGKSRIKQLYTHLETKAK